jgi:hypothetical protein
MVSGTGRQPTITNRKPTMSPITRDSMRKTWLPRERDTVRKTALIDLGRTPFITQRIPEIIMDRSTATLVAVADMALLDMAARTAGVGPAGSRGVGNVARG